MKTTKYVDDSNADVLDISPVVDLPAKPNAVAVPGESGYKIAYFRIVDRKLLPNRPTDSRADSELVLELGLIPRDTDISEECEGLYRVPAGLKTLRIMAGNVWPFGVPNGPSVDLSKLKG